MDTRSYPKTKLLVSLISLLLIVAPLHALDEGPTTSAPGYRPENENAAAFLDSLDSATIAVVPTLVRRERRTAYSYASQQLAVSMLNDSGLTNAKLANKRVDLGRLHYDSQWNLFQYGLSTVRQNLAGYKTDADYLMVMEILVPAGQDVFGVECYIIDREGHDMFSFLLNSHHQIFVDANLHATDSSEEAREDMLKAATGMAIAALQRQVEEAGSVDP